MNGETGDQYLTVNSVFLGLAWLLVSLRLYVRIHVTRHFGADDVLLIASLLVFTAYAVVGIVSVKAGVGRFADTLSYRQIEQSSMYYWYCELLYGVSTALVRLSVGVLIRRLCMKKIHLWLVYFTMAVVVIFTIVQFFLILFQCSPVDFFWTQYTGGSGTCMSFMVIPYVSLAQSVLFSIADWILGTLPIFLIWDLHMNIRLKCSLAFVLSLGILAGVASIVRVPYILAMADTQSRFTSMAVVALWSTVEAGVGIIAASAATLKPLIKSLSELTTRHTSRSISFYRPNLGTVGTFERQSYSPEAHRAPPGAVQRDFAFGQAITCDKYHPNFTQVVSPDGPQPHAVTINQSTWDESDENLPSDSSSDTNVAAENGRLEIHKRVEILRYSEGSGDESLSQWTAQDPSRKSGDMF